MECFNVTNMESMFESAVVFNQNLNSWNVSNVTNMEKMFSGATAFNGNITDWDVSKVKNMSYMFYNASNFDSQIAWWLPVNNVTNMSYMFANAYVFDSFVQDWLVSETCVLTNMFQDASGMINKYNAPATPTYTFFNQPTALNNWSNGNYNIYTVVGQWFADSSSPQFTNQSNSPYFIQLQDGIQAI